MANFVWWGKLIKKTWDTLKRQGILWCIAFCTSMVIGGCLISKQMDLLSVSMTKLQDDVKGKLDLSSTKLDAIQASIDPEKRPPLSRQQGLNVIDMQISRFVTALDARLNPKQQISVESIPPPPITAMNELGPNRTTPVPLIPPQAALPGADEGEWVFGLWFPFPKSPRATKDEKVNAAVRFIRAAIDKHRQAAAEGKQRVSDVFKLAEMDAQLIGQQLRSFKTGARDLGGFVEKHFRLMLQGSARGLSEVRREGFQQPE